MSNKKPKSPVALTADDILGFGKACSKEESPIDLSFNIMKEVRLPPLEWGNFDIIPKLMKISNTGMTAVLSGKWKGPRPFLSNGPISGRYVFSQLHFHWGRTVLEGSEHRLNGQALPLEAHVMFFKNVYENQDDAMRKTDGTVTIAYFFKLQDEENKNLEPIISSLPYITLPFSSHHTDNVQLNSLTPVFSSDYFMYWGNIHLMNILWIISRQPIGISPKQLSLFKNLLGANNKPIEKNYRDPRDLNDRVVFYINPSNNRSDILLPLQLPGIEIFEDPYEKIPDSFQQALKTISNSIPERNANKKSILDILSFNLSKSPNIADLKYTLAKTLLDLEKKESNDYGVLENYIKAKYASQRKQFLIDDREKKKNPNDDNEITKEIDDNIQDDDRSNIVLHKLKNTNEEINSKQIRMNIIDDIYTYPQGESEVFSNEVSKVPEENNIKVETDDENVCNSLNIDRISQISQEGTLENKEEAILESKNIGDNIYSNFSNESCLNNLNGDDRDEVIKYPEINNDLQCNLVTEHKPVIKKKSDDQVSQVNQQKSVSFAQFPPEVINEKEMDFETIKHSGVGSWLGEDKFSLLRKKLVKRINKHRLEYQQGEKIINQSEGGISNESLLPKTKIPVKQELGSGEKQEKMGNESAMSFRMRVKQARAKVNKAREEENSLKRYSERSSERSAWKP